MFDLQEVRAESGVCVSDEVRPLRITGARRLRVAQAAATYRQSTAAAAPMISLEQTNSVYCICITNERYGRCTCSRHMRSTPRRIFSKFHF